MSQRNRLAEIIRITLGLLPGREVSTVFMFNEFLDVNEP